MPRGKKKEDPFASLPEDFRDNVASYSTDELKGLVAKVAMANEDLRQMQGDDQDLAEKKEAAKEANKVYAEGFKENRLKIQFLKQALESRGMLATAATA